MTRLVMFLLTLFAGLDVLTICAYAVAIPNPSATVITALVGVLAALVLNGVVAIIKR